VTVVQRKMAPSRWRRFPSEVDTNEQNGSSCRKEEGRRLRQESVANGANAVLRSDFSSSQSIGAFRQSRRPL
jgi:hypothetical protein